MAGERDSVGTGCLFRRKRESYRVGVEFEVLLEQEFFALYNGLTWLATKANKYEKLRGIEEGWEY